MDSSLVLALGFAYFDRVSLNSEYILNLDHTMGLALGLWNLVLLWFQI